jgi:hypothetical protein
VADAEKHCAGGKIPTRRSHRQQPYRS